MATTTTPNVETTPKLPVNLTSTAVTKVKEIMGQQNPVPAGLRIGVVGGGCSGFSYSMSFENAPGVMDKVYSFDDLKVYVDATSAMYLNGCMPTQMKPIDRPPQVITCARWNGCAGSCRARGVRRFCSGVTLDTQSSTMSGCQHPDSSSA